MYHRSQRTGRRLGRQLFGLLDPDLVTSVLTSRLIEPRLDITLPIFVEMTVGDHVVAARSHLDKFCSTIYILNGTQQKKKNQSNYSYAANDDVRRRRAGNVFNIGRVKYRTITLTDIRTGNNEIGRTARFRDLSG